MIAENGSVTMDLDLNRLNGINSIGQTPTTLHFATAANSFFPILVFNDQLRGPEPGSMALVAEAQPVPSFPLRCAASLKRLVIEKLSPDALSTWRCVTPGVDSRFSRSKDTSMIINPTRDRQHHRWPPRSYDGIRRVAWPPVGCWCGCG